ncbi:MAG: glycosyltransferase family 4 protein [Proteobacteria bacterium]|nr:glycosyltransferase family 4 protein [Pseudomonadota bacterium]
MTMRICFLEDSIEFDGYSPTSRPLDGPQKALAYLSGTLAQRGHQVTVVNRARLPMTCDGVSWPGWSGERPAETDLLVAVGDATLFDLVPAAKRRVLWVPGDVAEVTAGARASALSRLRPDIVFHTYAQRDAWVGTDGLSAQVIAPAIAPSYFEDLTAVPSIPPRAIAVCHPLNGLEKLVRLWTDRVRVLAPTAELHVYSARLDRAILGGEVPADLKAIHDLVRASAGSGIVVQRPQPDPQMADAYRAARIFVHPGLANETMALHLMEAQAAGLPAVAFATGPIVRERILEGQTGRICYGDEAFAQSCIDLMLQDDTWRAMADKARELQRGRSWPIAAAEWEEKFA